MNSTSIYEAITAEIIGELEKGSIPWRQPWIGGSPANLLSKKDYRGVNYFLLSMKAQSKKYQSRYWLTFLQAKQLGGHVKSGEKGTQVVFWKFLSEESKNEVSGEVSEKRIPMLRAYTVFNLDQTEGVKVPKGAVIVENDISPIESAETIVKGYVTGPTIETGDARAYYRPSADTVNMPRRELFNSPEEFYSTLFHELTHSTGHERRLNREGIAEAHFFGEEIYSKEELIAEMGAAFLCGTAGIANSATVQNSGAYLKSWLKVLRADKRLVVTAAAQAQKAADHILGRKWEAEKAAQ